MKTSLNDIRAKLQDIHDDIRALELEHLEKTPEHFSYLDVGRAFFGAIIISLAFALKGLLITVSQNLSYGHIIAFVLVTLVILVFEIYFIGYLRVPDKDQRKPGQFIMKRLAAFYMVAIAVSVGLVYLFGINSLLKNSYEVIKVIVVLSLPSALGAGIGDLLKKY